jgi:(1->4)-alpha-D-glucan 1-alpha-D-glucosylmutase
MTDASGVLGRLAALCGIAPRWADVRGRWHEVDDETRLALLGSMGIEVGSDASLAASLEEIETRPWRRVLDPVHVLRLPFSRIEIAVTLPATEARRAFDWTIEWEDGEDDRGKLSPAELPRSDAREIDGREMVRVRLAIDVTPRLGYHTLAVAPREGDGPRGETRLIVAPESCDLPEALVGDGRVWGPAAQLYSVRSKRNWGMGDFGDLGSLVALFAQRGADIVGLNPLHALFPLDPRRASPYSPSSRVFVNPLYLDLEAVPDFAECEHARRAASSPEHQAKLDAARQGECVEYSEVAALERPCLEQLYRHFRERHVQRDTVRARDFRAFRDERGAILEAYGRFEALAEHFRGQDTKLWGWPVWPEAYRRPDSPEVAAFAERNRGRVEFHQYLQWECDRQLGVVSASCRDRGLAVGLYLDLALSVAGDGFDTWWRGDAFAHEARIGAPPDDFNPLGQDWGLPPWIPDRLRERAYEPFVECLRANMRHAGALRIDHVMGLMRLFWVPPGMPVARGAYVHYPFDDLLGILALESRRHRCMVVGEDLGTVPEEVRTALAPLGVLSSRLLCFMKKEDGSFIPPREWPRDALAAFATHDLPTLAGYWEGHDIAVRDRLGLYPSEGERDAQTARRAEDRERLLVALEREGLLSKAAPASFPSMSPELATAVHRYLARSPARVMAVQLEDLLGQRDQVNLPGTTAEHPNWRRKLPHDLETMEHDARLDALARALEHEHRGGRDHTGT